ncbi:hypothetical protein HY251_05515 [bacterium]|nr:hypothetical protein [bacterium]
MDEEPQGITRGEERSGAETTEKVAVFYDLATRDGRRAVEVRSAEALGNGYFASARATVYSCSYTTQAERILAFRRARRYCDAGGRTIVHFGCAADRRAAWQ